MYFIFEEFDEHIAFAFYSHLNWLIYKIIMKDVKILTHTAFFFIKTANKRMVSSYIDFFYTNPVFYKGKVQTSIKLIYGKSHGIDFKSIGVSPKVFYFKLRDKCWSNCFRCFVDKNGPFFSSCFTFPLNCFTSMYSIKSSPSLWPHARTWEKPGILN